jgi:hypothetical protein
MLYEKIVNNFKSLNDRKEYLKNLSHRHKWRKRKQKKLQLTNNEDETSSAMKTESQM